LNMSAKATLKRLNSNSIGNDDLIFDAQSGENLFNYFQIIDKHNNTYRSQTVGAK